MTRGRKRGGREGRKRGEEEGEGGDRKRGGRGRKRKRGEKRERGGEKGENGQGVHCSSRKQTVAVLPISAGISSKLFSPALRCCRFTSNLWEGGRGGREGREGGERGEGGREGRGGRERGRRKEGVYDNQHSSQKVTVH